MQRHCGSSQKPLSDKTLCGHAQSLQLCQTLPDAMNCNMIGSSVHRILQARIPEWITMPYSRDLPNQGVETASHALQKDSLTSEPPGWPRKNTTEIWGKKKKKMSPSYLRKSLLNFQGRRLGPKCIMEQKRKIIDRIHSQGTTRLRDPKIN